MSATLDKILEEIQRLPPEERQQLREALDAPALLAEESPATQTPARASEQRWIDAHRDDYVGQWVVVEGESLIVHGHDARIVYEAARSNGVEVPFLVRVEPRSEPSMGGW